LKESYFSKKTAAVVEEVSEDGEADAVEVSPMMEQFLKALRKS